MISAAAERYVQYQRCDNVFHVISFLLSGFPDLYFVDDRLAIAEVDKGSLIIVRVTVD